MTLAEPVPLKELKLLSHREGIEVKLSPARTLAHVYSRTLKTQQSAPKDLRSSDGRLNAKPSKWVMSSFMHRIIEIVHSAT